MKLMCPEKHLAKLFPSVLLVLAVAFAGVSAQSKRASAKKATAKKSVAQAKDARKDQRKAKGREAVAKRDDKRSAKKRETARDSRSARYKKDTKRSDDRASVRDRDRDRDRKARNDPKSRRETRAEARRAELQRRKREEERRQAILAEKRRREQLAREARERRLAFERGLRTETAENIARDNTDGEDLNVRRAAVDALSGHAGTAVVMEAQTGKVLTIVNQDWAIRNSFKPCSTIKLVTAVGGLNEKVINTEGNIGQASSGMDLDDALAFSNNGYFQRVGSNFGNAKMIEYAKTLGLGEPTGINAPGETGGRLPYGNNNRRIYSHGDDFEVTPLQLAVMVSALSNGGRKVTPQIPRPRVERVGFQPKAFETVDLPMADLQGVLPGMMGAAEYGTARRGVDSSMGVAGKTGSCIGKGSWVGLFASVAPVEQPKFAVVVITRGERERGKYAAAIAGKIYGALAPQIRRDPVRLTALRDLRHTPRNTDTRMTARVDEDEDEDTGEADGGDASDDTVRGAIIAGSSGARAVVPQPAPEKKIVVRTAQSKPVAPPPSFRPVVIQFDRSGKEALKTRPRVVKNK